MPHHDLVVIGGSAGSLQALTTILNGLPARFPASILVVMHTRAENDGVLPQILSRNTKLPVRYATDNMRLQRGAVAVARPDFQLLVTPNGGNPMARSKEPEPQLPADQTDVAEMEDTFGSPSALTCPDCGGALWELVNGRVVRYKCHVGHQFAPDSLVAAQSDAVEGALWAAVRVLEEHAELRMRMAKRAESVGLTAVSSGFAEGARNSQEQAAHIRALLFGGGNSVDSTRAAVAADVKPRAARKHATHKRRRRG